MAKKILKVNEYPLSNKHLPVPLEMNEKVIFDEDENDPSDQYIWIKHNQGKTKSRFSKSYFVPVSAADRQVN